MAELSYGCGRKHYGSAWHLLRFLGYHREILNDRIRSATGQSAVRWLDFGFRGNGGDDEITGASFLSEGNSREIEALSAWKDYWPQGGTQHHWDAVGRAVARDGTPEWILVEAKANVEEMNSACGAVSAISTEKISGAITLTACSLGVEDTDAWMKEYYQFANRLVFLDFLLRHNVRARLVYIYFCGDSRSDRVFCPLSEKDWRPAISRQHSRMGLKDSSAGILSRVHRIFLRVDGR